MAKFPSMPLFTDAYMADTRHLTAAQHGAYLLMLMTAWRMPDGMLPNDDDFLSRICCMDKRTWQRNKQAVLTFWEHPLKQNLDNTDGCEKVDTQKIFQRRLLDERKFVADKVSKKSAAGKVSALKRNDRHSTDVEQNANRTSTPTPTPTPNIKKTQTNVCAKKHDSTGTRLTPDWTLPEDWGDWAVAKGLAVAQILDEEEKFRDYWISKSGAMATKRDWYATWRNWIRRKLENGS